MGHNCRRASRIGFGLLAALIAINWDAASIHAQVQVGPGGAELTPAEQSRSGFLLPNRQLTQGLKQSQQLIERKDYARGLPLLQQVIDRLETEEDAFYAPDPEKPGSYVSLKAAADALIRDLPPEGLKSYELQFGTLARQEFEAAVQNSDLSRIESVVRRYFHTNAGLAAMNRVGHQYLDRSEPLTAALHFRRLLRSARARAVFEPILSLKAAIAWGRAGMPEVSLDVLSDLKKRSRTASVTIRGREWPFFERRADSLEWLKQVLGDDPSFRSLARESWTMFRGGPSRNVASDQASPLGLLDWKYRAIPMEIYDLEPDKLEVLADFESRLRALAQTSFKDLIRYPAAHPLVVGDQVVFRSIGNLKAVDGVSGDLLWEASVPDTELDRLVEKTIEGQTSGGMQFEVDQLLSRRAWRDCTAGMISSDGKQVFSIDPLRPAATQSVNMRVPFPVSSSVTNLLRAFDLETGKFVWQIGGPSNEADLPFAGNFFLGPPMVLGGRLYVISEADGEIRLQVLNAQETPGGDEPWTIREDWSQLLVPPAETIQQVPVRGVSGITPSYADGVLVCPTTSGAVIGVDLGRRQLLWGYRYEVNQNAKTTQPGVMIVNRATTSASSASAEDRGRWLDSAPTVSGKFVLLTPRDSNELHCLRISDGQLVWRRPRGQGLFVAGVDRGRVIIVGHSHVESVSLTHGNPVWNEPALVGPTCGRGFLAGSVYYVPLETGAIAGVDLKTGRLLAKSPVRGDFELGNLVAVKGRIISQSVHEIVALNSLDSIQQELKQNLVAGNRPETLVDRGELRLQLGEEAAGLADLRNALETIPTELRQPLDVSELAEERIAVHLAAMRARALLRQSLMEGLRLRFDQYAGTVDELEALIDTGEQQFQLRRALAEGLQSAGRFRPAFLQYLNLIVDSEQEQLVRLGQDHTIRGDRWVAPRVAELFEDADDSDRTAMELETSKRIENALANDDITTLLALSRTLKSFSSIDNVRLKLLEFEGDQVTEQQAIEQLQALSTSNQLSTAAAADYRLAQRYLATGLFENARASIGKLGTRWKDVVCTGTQTGADVAEDLRLEPGLQQFLAARPNWSEKPFKARIEPRSKLIVFSNPIRFSGDPGAFRDWSFRLASSRSHVLAFDGDGRERWRFSLQAADSRFQQSLYGNKVRVHRHFLIFDMNSYVMVVDTLADAKSPRLLWRRNLTKVPVTNGRMPQNIMLRGPVRNRAGGKSPNGGAMLGPISDDSLTYISERRVVCAELVTGDILWQREGIPEGTLITGNSRTIALLEPGTNDAILLRAADGAGLGSVSLPPVAERQWLHGTLALYERSDEKQVKWTLVEMTTGEIRWQGEFSVGTVSARTGDRWLSFLEPNGRFQLVDSLTGQVRLDQRIDPVENLDSIVVLRLANRLLLMTNQKKENKRWFGVFPGNSEDVPVNGPVVCFDFQSGRQLWVSRVDDQRVDPTLPGNLPILVMTTRRLEMAAVQNFSRVQQRFAAAVMDLRDGSTVFERSGMSSMAPFLIDVTDPEKGLQVHFSRESLILATSNPAPAEKEEP